MNTLAERLKMAMEGPPKVKIVDLARACDVQPPSVSGWLSGTTKSIEGANLLSASRFLRVRPDWLALGKGTMRETDAKAPIPDDVVTIYEKKITFDEDSGLISMHDEIVEGREPALFTKAWLKNERLKPNKIIHCAVHDNSMEPFLFVGDAVLINLEETDVRDGKIYAFRYGDEFRVKQLFRKLDGTLILRSFNPAYKDEEVPLSLVKEHISIVGRVRSKLGQGGL